VDRERFTGWDVVSWRCVDGLRLRLRSTDAGPARDVEVGIGPPGRPGFLATDRLSAEIRASDADPGIQILARELSARIRERSQAASADALRADFGEATRWEHVHSADKGLVAPDFRDFADVRLCERCNQACAFCSATRDMPNLFPSLADFREALPRMRAAGLRVLNLTGGEPTLVPWLGDAVRLARDAGVERVMVSTNATGLARAGAAARLKDAGVVRLLVSLHSARAEVSDRLTRRRGTHARTLRGIDAALAAGLEVSVNLVACRDNYRELPEFMAWLRERFQGRIVQRLVSVMAPIGSAADRADLMVRIAELMPFMRAAVRDCLERGEDVRIPGICGLPLCVLGGLEAASDEALNPPGVGFPRERTHLESCGRCARRDRCTGVWRAYLDAFGPDEFVPL
jgi:sulfatase maturation enzyme AslB (radical SAM superfamily)